MPASITDYNQYDQQIWDEELNGFVPQRIFDAHIHMLKLEHLSAGTSERYTQCAEADLSTLQAWARTLYPGPG